MGKTKRKFTLHPQYSNFVPGKKRPPIEMRILSPSVTSLDGCLAVLLETLVMVSAGLFLSLMAVSAYGFEADFNRIEMMLPLVGGPIFCAAMTFWGLRDIRRYLYARHHQRQLATRGLLLEGEITAITGYTPGFNGPYSIRIWYTFETPRKKIINGFA